jgi:hypothetical protein
MEYGLLIKNAGGDVLVDNKHLHPKLIEKKPVYYSAAGIYETPFTQSAKMVLITAFSDDTLVNIHRINFVNGFYQSVGIVVSSAGNVTLRIYEL